VGSTADVESISVTKWRCLTRTYIAARESILMRPAQRCLSAAVPAIALLFTLGCPSPPPPTGSAGAPTGSASPPPKEPGPPRAIIVVDVSASNMKFRSDIYKTVRLFLHGFARDQETDLLFVKLDHEPKLELQFNEARVSEPELTEFEAEFSKDGPEGGGTDQVGAMQLVLDYAQPTDRQPEEVNVLWFSDMIVDSPRGKTGAFQGWDEFDWAAAQSSGVRAWRFYFVEHATAVDLSARARATGLDALFVEPPSMLNDLKQGRVQLP